MASGIYEIRNTKNGRAYIGSTIDFDQRWEQHRRDLGKGVHHSVKLQRAWKKYGADVFKFSILERVHNREMLFAIEQMWIDAENCVQKGYNIAPIAGYPGDPNDIRCKDPAGIANGRGKNLSRQAQFPDEESKKLLLDELIVRMQAKATDRKWPVHISPRKVSRLALERWVCGGCSVCHGVASFQWEDEDHVRHQIDCDACGGTGTESFEGGRQAEQQYILDTIEVLESLYREAFALVVQEACND